MTVNNVPNTTMRYKSILPPIQECFYLRANGRLFRNLTDQNHELCSQENGGCNEIMCSRVLFLDIDNRWGTVVKTCVCVTYLLDGLKDDQMT